MNHTVSRVIAQLIVDAGKGKWRLDGSLTDGDFAVGYGGKDLPDEGDYAVGVFDTEGEDQNARNLRTGEQAMRPGVTVLVRAPTDDEASPRAWAIATFLDTLLRKRVRVGESTFYCVHNFSRKYDPTFLHQEERGGRVVWVFRGLVTITMES